jgi:hypothetical protein
MTYTDAPPPGDFDFLRALGVAVIIMAAIAFAILFLGSCHPAYTAVDRNGELGAESMLSRLYALDAGPQVRAYSRAGLCSVQASLAAHDAGRLVGSVECVPSRKP